MSKQCSKCNNIKSYDNYSKRKDTSDGYFSYCKQCNNEYNKLHYKDNTEKRINYRVNYDLKKIGFNVEAKRLGMLTRCF